MLSLGVEYNYVQINAEDRLGVNIPPTILSNHRVSDVDTHSVLARLNLKLSP